jgi:hypothetical protein
METEGNSSWWLSISINFGVLEYWSNDERIDAFFFKTPILHHSKAETFKNFCRP